MGAVLLPEPFPPIPRGGRGRNAFLRIPESLMVLEGTKFARVVGSGGAGVWLAKPTSRVRKRGGVGYDSVVRMCTLKTGAGA